MPWKQMKSGAKYFVPREKSPAEIIYQREQRRLYAEQIFQQEREHTNPTNAVFQPKQRSGRPRGYWAKAVKQLHDQLKENGTLHLFDERIGSPSKMLELMHRLELCTIEERDDRHMQKYVGNALEKYKDAASERMLPRAELHQDRSTRGNISEMAQNGMVEDRNRSGKAWDLS